MKFTVIEFDRYNAHKSTFTTIEAGSAQVAFNKFLTPIFEEDVCEDDTVNVSKKDIKGRKVISTWQNPLEYTGTKVTKSETIFVVKKNAADHAEDRKEIKSMLKGYKLKKGKNGLYGYDDEEISYLVFKVK